MEKMPGFLFFCGVLLLSNSAQGAESQYTAKMLRDPFTEAAENISADDTIAMEQSMDTLVVEGILSAMNNPVAIINGKIYHVGSWLGPGQVVQIEKEGVTLSVKGKRFTLKQNRGKTNADTQKKPY